MQRTVGLALPWHGVENIVLSEILEDLARIFVDRIIHKGCLSKKMP